MSTALRVLHLNSERSWRGGERQTLWLAVALQRLGHHSVIGARPGTPLADRAAQSGLELSRFSPLMPVDPLAAWLLGRELVRGGFDVVHAHTGNAFTQAALARRPRGCALVACKRVDRPSHAGAASRQKYQRADALIAVSRHVRQVLLEGGAPPERTSVVPDGIDLSRPMQPAGRELLAALGVVAGIPLVVMVAALVPTKAPEMFVRGIAEAVRGGAKLQALLVGDGELAAVVAQERQRLALGGTLHLAGWRDDTDALIAAADLVVLTSRGEGQGSVLLDAMQCGKPVVATSAGGIPDAVADGETGLLVPVDDSASLGRAIATLVMDESLRARLGAAARQRAQLFSLERTAELTVDVYRAALARRLA